VAQTFARFGADLAVPLSRATSYADAAVARARGWPMRIGFAVFITAASGAIAPDGVGPIWLACVVCAQSIDAWIAAPLRRRPEARPSARRMIVYAASLTLNALIYSAISVDFWFSGSDAGRIFAMLIPAAALLNGALQAEGAPRRLIFTVHATFILGLPMAAGILSPARDLAEMGFVSGAGALIVLHVTMAVRRIQDGARDVRAARDAAQAERRRAEAANAAKSDFLATISHEIRTPLNAVVASAALLRRTELSPLQAEYVEMLANASELLLGLLNDVLDISRIESGKLEVEAAEFDLVAKLEASVRLWRAQTEPKGVTLAFDPAGLPRRIVTDPLRLQQIVFNLLSNAAKFTAAGTIIVRGGRLSGPAGERLWLEVADTGCGMDAATAERVFESFEQAGAATARRHGGAGLGLSISRRLAELLGGGLSVESQAGAGSTFRLETPLLGPLIRRWERRARRSWPRQVRPGPGFCWPRTTRSISAS